MTGRAWIALGASSAGAVGFLVEGKTVKASAEAASEHDVLERLTADNVPWLRVGDGVPDKTPCAVRPDAGLLLPGVEQEAPAGHMGGWTRLALAGFLRTVPNWDGVVCIVEGDVTHWIHVSADEIISFSSFLTLRLMASLGGSAPPDQNAIRDTQSRPERLASDLRQAELTGRPGAITGHLVGAEMTAARVYWLGQQVMLIASDPVAGIYASALSELGITAAQMSLDTATEHGLSAMAHLIEGV